MKSSSLVSLYSNLYKASQNKYPMATTSQQRLKKKWKNKNELKKELKNTLSGRGYYRVVSPTDFSRNLAGFFGVHVSENIVGFIKQDTIPIRGMVSFVKSNKDLLVEVTTRAYISATLRILFVALVLIVLGIAGVINIASSGVLCCISIPVLLGVLFVGYHYFNQSKANEKKVNEEIQQIISDVL